MTTETIIIGGGPAGFAAALFAAKAKRKVVMIHKGTTPLLGELHWMLPGFETVGPKEWVDHLRAQIVSKGVTLLEEAVTQATLGASEKKIATASGKTFEAPVVILATGCYERKGLIVGEEKFSGHGVHYNAYQDGLWFEEKTLIAEGKTEQAIREILYLSRFAKKIYFIVPAMKIEGEEKLVSALQDNTKIEVLLSASIKAIEGEQNLKSVTVLSAGDEKHLEADGVFLYARTSKPQYEFLKGTIEISEEGSVLVDDQLMTSIPGVFACGDMIAGFPQLPFVSASQGMAAAIHAEAYLANLNF